MEVIRKKVLSKLTSIIENEKLSHEIEESIYDYIGEYCETNNIVANTTNQEYMMLYLEHSSSVYHNLKSDSYIKNTKMADLVKGEKLKPGKINDYTKMFPNKWKKFKNDLELMNNEVLETPETATTTQFRCSKCRKNTKCCYFSMQTRSADEPMTNFITCTECNHNWRE